MHQPIWLTNLLHLCAVLKNRGKTVVVGYANQQLLYLATANIDALAAGTRKNLRLFSAKRFATPSPGGGGPVKDAYYYGPTTLSEFNTNALDTAANANLLGRLRTPEELNGHFADILFTSASPSTTRYTQQAAYRHYLHTLRQQCLQATTTKFVQSLAYQRDLLENARQLLRELHQHEVHPISVRDMTMAIGSTLEALAHLEQNPASFRLKRQWKS